MKNLLLLLVLVAMPIFSSCDEEDLDVDFSTSLSGDIPVNITGGNTYNESTTIQLANSDTDDYLDKLKSVTITKMTYEIDNFTGDPEGTITGVLKADGVTLHSVTGLVVSNADGTGTIFEVTDTTALTNAGNALLNNKMLTLQVMGTADYSDFMNFIVKIKIDLNVVANPLE
jgi:hypothetical protein